MDETSIKAGRTGPGKMRAGVLLAGVRGRGGDRLPLRAEPGAQARGGVPRGFLGHAVERRLRRVRGVREAPGPDARALLEPLPAQVRGRQGKRSGGRRRGAVADRGAVPAGEDDPQEEARGAGEAGASARACRPGSGRVLRLVPATAPAGGPVAEQPVRAGAGLRGRARGGAAGVSGGPRGGNIDTNHLERGLRPIPMGRRNWLFAWTELGARRVGAIQSLLATCQLQGVNPYIYLVDVLQRIDRHPAKRAVELTPRVWKTRFADNPLRSDLDRARDPPLQ